MAGGLILGAMAATTVGGLVWHHLSSKRAWGSLAEELGFEFFSTFLRGFSLMGRLRGLDVEILKVHDEDGQSRVMVNVHDVFPGFTLVRENLLNRLSAPDVQIGDALLDRQARIEGDRDCALAVLGPEARDLVESLVLENGGKISAEMLQVPLRKLGKVRSNLDRVLDLAELLRRPSAEEIPHRLAERALEDPSSGVRLEAFRRLEASYAGSEFLRSVAERLMASPDAELSLQACRSLLDDEELNTGAVREVVKIALAGRLDPPTRSRAVETLARPQFSNDAVPALAEILAAAVTPSDVWQSALEGLVRLGARDELLRVEPPDDPEQAELLAEGLGTTDVGAQLRLVEMLDHPQDRVREAAARALGRVGDVGAVASLRRVAESGQLFRSGPARAAEAAIVEIKGRAGGSQAGEISLAAVEPLQGAVSPAEDDEITKGGEVSLA